VFVTKHEYQHIAVCVRVCVFVTNAKHEHQHIAKCVRVSDQRQARAPAHRKVCVCARLGVFNIVIVCACM